jgi:hypothetical protein
MHDHHSRGKTLMKYFYHKKGIWFHLIGIGCLLWFIVRVVPKPTRSQYPCQQVSMSIALTYIAFWGVLFGGMVLWIRLVKVKTASLIPTLIAFSVILCSVSGGVFAATFFSQPSLNTQFWDPVPNDPMGTGQGLHPGRVVWVWNPDATETSLTGYWWEPANNNQTVINGMVSAGIQGLAGETNDTAAWEQLFRFFNQHHGSGDIGYQSGEKIALKINLNNCWEQYLNPYTQKDNQLDASPYVVKALLRQFVTIVGVAQEDITVFDSSRSMANWFYDQVYPEFPNVKYLDAEGGATGRTQVQPSDVILHLADGSGLTRTLPTCVTEAKYLINMPILKRHPINQGVTLSGKNFFGTWIEPVSDVHNYHMDAFTAGNTAPQTDLFAADQLGGKTLLFLGDGLYATKVDHRTIAKFEMYPFNNDWTNSMFFSQDPVAMDSVMFDFLFAEGTNPVEGSQNYLHQSAVPPANTYDPENDGTFLNHSLGVHEHCNPAANIFSSERYVGPSGNGIEYVAVNQNQETPSVVITYPQENYLYFFGKELFAFPKTIVVGSVPVQTRVSGFSSGVEKVEFYLDGKLMSTDTVEPYTWNWSKISFFRHTLQVITYPLSGESISDEIIVWKIL